MPDRTWRTLIVEDDYFIAHELVKGLETAGFEVVGPVPSLAKALSIVEAERIDGALLNVNLDGEKVWEVADALIERRIPVVFVTGYERSSIPVRYTDVPLCLKPVEADTVIDALTRAANRSNARG